jgi:3'(2'), 5'-bisphosphate nucleotidase
MTTPSAMTDAELASHLAIEAGIRLVELRERLTAERAPQWKIKDAGDVLSHDYLMEALSEYRPNDAVLSEEGAEDPRRRSAERVWIVDPLDGTNEYSEYGRHDWAVHIALWERGDLTAGAVSLPALQAVFATDPAPELPAPTRTRPRMITSRTRAPYAAMLVAEALNADAVRLGSAGAKTMAVILGEADIYIHDGGMYQWDSAAPAVVAAASGLHVSRVSGAPLVYNDPDPWLPDLLVCRPEWKEPVLNALWGDQWRHHER